MHLEKLLLLPALSIVLTLTSYSQLKAQTAPPAPPSVAYDMQPIPSDPAAALDLIGKANGLGSDELKPWYLKAHYKSYDPKGKPAVQGTIEIWRSSKDSYRVTYTSDAFTQTYYQTPTGSLRVGSPARVPYAESLLWDEILHPAETFREAKEVKTIDKKIGNVEMACLVLPAKNVPVPDSWCLDKMRQLDVRVSNRNGYSTVFNRVELFQHRFVGGEVSMFDFGQPVLEYSIENLRTMNSADQALLAPPPGVTLEEAFSDPILEGPSPNIKQAHLIGQIISKTPPRYPAEAKQRRAQGMVRIRATIGKDGTVLNPMIVRDPDSALSHAALEAVTKWHYNPYERNGSPVEVLTTITVTFTLGG